MSSLAVTMAQISAPVWDEQIQYKASQVAQVSKGAIRGKGFLCNPFCLKCSHFESSYFRIAGKKRDFRWFRSSQTCVSQDILGCGGLGLIQVETARMLRLLESFRDSKFPSSTRDFRRCSAQLWSLDFFFG